MTRQQKYPDTPTFHYHNANPRNRITTDCVIRAISTAIELPYNQVVMELAEMQCSTGYDDGDDKLYEKYLASKGWIKHKQPRKDDGTKYTGSEFCREAREYTFNYPDRMIAHIGGHHIVAIVDARIWDIWNCSHKCIGKYWTKG